MQDKNRQEKNKPLPELRSSVTEILVANGRAFQPFIRTFRYTGENVTKQNLGTLLGVFEIDDQSEDSAYIVNFLASVAKKEYFNNPRRGAIESFEAALHKINLALAELVKHGNVTWLGKFHGALGVLEKNNLHFSVTGHAAILLLRNGTIADLSVGLASDESHIHPIKTFVEVSSGRLAQNDQILLSSPELLALFSLEDLNKHATRLGSERFTQFLKTALVNELDMAGLLTVEISENIATEEESQNEKKPAKAAPTRVKNVFSQSAFTPKNPSEPSSVEEVLIAEHIKKEEEYIDSKTGHIYVQGDTPEQPSGHPLLESLSLKLQEMPRLLSGALAVIAKRLRKTKKGMALAAHATHEEGQALGRKIARACRRQLRKYQEARAQAKAQAEELRAEQERERAENERLLAESQKTAPPLISDIPRPTPSYVPEESPEASAETETDDEMPQFMKEKLAQFYRSKPSENEALEPSTPAQTRSFMPRDLLAGMTASLSAYSQAALRWCRQISGSMLRNIRSIGTIFSSRSMFARILQSLRRMIVSSYHTLQSRRLLLPVVGLLLLLGGAGWWFFFSQSTPTQNSSDSQNEPPQTLTEAALSNNSNTLAVIAVLTDTPDPIIATVILSDETYAVTRKSIIAVRDQKVFPLPTGTSAAFAAAMDDLRLIFIYTEAGKLYAWSPISKTFVENTLPFEGNTKIAGIDTYLTYLYVLDSITDQVYRFPRADGGFGAGTPWLKETVPIEETSRLAVNETLFIAPDTSTLHGYFRGRATGTFELPEGLEITDLYTHPGLENVYALDKEHHRILIWNQEGRLLKELSDEHFSQGQTLSVNEKQGEVFIGTQDSLLSYKLK